MSMDRKSRSWPGGPTPPNPRPYERLGAKNPQFEVGQHTEVVKQEILAQVVNTPGVIAGYNTSVWMSVPDARLLAVLSIAFEPDAVEGLGALSTQRIHLAATEDFGRDPAPVENLIGDANVFVPMIQTGLRGFLYSPTEEVQGLQANMYLDGPYQVIGGNLGMGKWVAKARWQALRPMSEIEWADAVSKMVLLKRQDGIKLLGLNVPA